MKHDAEALPYALEALGICELCYPSDTYGLVIARHNVGRLLHYVGRHADSLPHLTVALGGPLQHPNCTERDVDVSFTQQVISTALSMLGREANALELERAALDL